MKQGCHFQLDIHEWHQHFFFLKLHFKKKCVKWDDNIVYSASDEISQIAVNVPTFFNGKSILTPSNATLHPTNCKSVAIFLAFHQNHLSRGRLPQHICWAVEGNHVYWSFADWKKKKTCRITPDDCLCSAFSQTLHIALSVMDNLLLDCFYKLQCVVWQAVCLTDCFYPLRKHELPVCFATGCGEIKFCMVADRSHR